jgi:hypothetical protein
MRFVSGDWARADWLVAGEQNADCTALESAFIEKIDLEKRWKSPPLPL